MSSHSIPSSKPGCLKSLIEDLREKLENLAKFDQAYEINLYCDDLEGQVITAIECASKHLQRIQEELITEITSYRNGLLQSASFSDSSSGASDPENKLNHVADLKKLKEEVQRFNDELTASLERITIDNLEFASELKEKSLSRVKEFTERSLDIEKKMRKETFQGNMLKFRENRLYTIENDHIGSLQPSTEYFNDVKRPSKIEALSGFAGHTGQIVNVLALSDGTLATCSTDRTVRIWNCHSGVELRVYGPHLSAAESIAELPNALLAVGFVAGEIGFFDLTNQYQPTITIAHTGVVLSLKVLSNGNFTSFSTDDTIKVWSKHHRKSAANLLTITGHGCNKTLLLFDMFSNGYFVTCSSDVNNGVLRIWNSKTGKKMREISTGIASVNCLSVLDNDDIVVGSWSGDLKIFNLAEPALSRKVTEKSLGTPITAITHLRGDLVVISIGQNPSILQVWDLQRAELVQKAESNHFNTITVIAKSPDNRYVATGSADRTAKLWSIN